MVDIFKVSYTVFKDASSRYPVYHFPTPNGDGYVVGTGHSQVVYTSTITEPSEVSDFITNLLPTSELSEMEGDVIAKPTLVATGNLQKQYDIGSNVIYIGTAKPTIATSATGWTIQKFTLDIDGNVTDKKTTVAGDAIWDNRLFEVYN